MAAGGSHSLALVGDGTVRSWGWNAYGQLDTNTTTDAHRPVAVTGLDGVTSLAAGALHRLAARGDPAKPLPAGARSVSGGAGHTVAAAP